VDDGTKVWLGTKRVWVHIQVSSIAFQFTEKKQGLIMLINLSFTLCHSEGISLTQDDEKGYWGEIKEVPTTSAGDNEGDCKKVMIEGRVMMNFGMMPWYSISQSVGRFKMTEIEDTLEDEVNEDEDEEEEYEALGSDVVMESALNFDSLLEMNEADEDGEDIEPFELPGAFG
jgi:hypothetical protein